MTTDGQHRSFSKFMYLRMFDGLSYEARTQGRLKRFISLVPHTHRSPIDVLDVLVHLELLLIILVRR